MKLAPVVIFCYQKMDCLNQTISALQNNHLANESDLIIYSDGAKRENDKVKVDWIRTYLKTITGFKSIKIIEQEKNLGLANSIITGVTAIIKEFGKVIVVEDDLVTSKNFLQYMNSALTYYESDEKVYSISGHKPNISIPNDYKWDCFFTLRISSWGWATWADRWLKVNWDMEYFEEFSKNRKSVKQFNSMGSDLFPLLKRQYEGKADSWAVRWCFDQFKKNQYTVYPIVSKVQNIGFILDATHKTKNPSHFITKLDSGESLEFNFVGSETGMDSRIVRSFRNHYGLKARIISKLKSILSR